MRDIDAISGDVVDVALRLHRDLGPGLLESVYEAVLAARLNQMGYGVVRQQPVSIDFEGVHIDGAFKMDLLVDGRLIVEIKSVERLLPVHAAKFVLNRHPWDEPLQRIYRLTAAAGMPLATPVIGQVVPLGDTTQVFRPWWQELK